MTLQASPGADGVEFVTLEDFFVADNSAVYEQIIPPHSPHAANNQNENTQNGRHLHLQTSMFLPLSQCFIVMNT